MMRLLSLLLLALPMVWAGCAIETESPSASLQTVGEGELLPEPVEPDAGIRERRRMDLDQLADSMEVVSGGIRWTEIASTGQEVDLFVSLGPTLGYPDYISRTREDLTVSIVFEKFLGDAARHVCSTMVGREIMQGASTKVLMLFAGEDETWESNPDAVQDNMRYLLLRFHGLLVGRDDPRLDPWLWMFRSSLATDANPAVAWHGICVALFTHPDFYTY